jgi:hypothetical protein
MLKQQIFSGRPTTLNNGGGIGARNLAKATPLIASHAAQAALAARDLKGGECSLNLH